MMAEDAESLPQHVEATVQTIAKLHEQHYRDASRLQQLIERTTGMIGRPYFAVALTIGMTIWVGGNIALLSVHAKAPDAPPFSWLQMIISVMALYVTILILATQRREDQLAASRAQLTLQLAVLGDQKTAKIIELLEELRRDSPHLNNRIDQEARAMAVASDPEGLLNAIQQSHEDLSASDFLAA